MLKITLIVIALFIVLIVLTAIILGAEFEKEFMTTWETCDGNCKSCKDKDRCMNRPY